MTAGRGRDWRKADNQCGKGDKSKKSRPCGLPSERPGIGVLNQRDLLSAVLIVSCIKIRWLIFYRKTISATSCSFKSAIFLSHFSENCSNLYGEM